VNVGPRVSVPRLCFAVLALAPALLGVEHVFGQGPATALTVLSRDPRRAIPVTVVGGQEMVGLDDLATSFQVTVRDESGALTVSYKGRTVVLTPDQTIVSVAGRVISLPSSPVRIGNRWLVPIDFISRALGGIYDARIELRRASHLVIVGDLRVPRLTLRQEATGNGARLTVDIMPRANTAVAQDGNQRLTIKVEADALDVVFPPGQVAGLIQGYRSVDVTTFALVLGPRYASFRASTQVADASSSLVIDLIPAPADVPPPPTTTQVESVAPAALAEPPALATLGSGVRTIAIDAGHGGDDIGAKGADGTTEKVVTLAIARKVKASIEARLGVRVIMTRDDDRRVAVTDRTALANNNKADLFISLHANQSFRSNVTGTAVYVASFEDGAVDQPGLVPERLPVFGGGIRDIELVPWNLAQIRYRRQSEILATAIAEQFRERVPLAARPIDHAPLLVLESANMPAVLIETGYLSNAEQARLLGSADFQSLLAQGIVEAIVKFRDASTGFVEGAVR
jgi:N-acetylmuramoyl-L-alanine amidase